MKKHCSLTQALNGAQHGNYLRALFQMGNLKNALDNWRWEKVHSYGYSNHLLWDGTNIKGRTILLYGGTYGDEIQFIRYAPLVAECGARVVFVCLKELVSLLKSVTGIHQILSSDEPLPDFDVHCSIRSLPIVFNTSTETVPSKVPYITVSSLLINEWRHKVLHDESKLKIGLVWTSGGTPSDHMGWLMKKKSFPLEVFSLLAQLGDISFYSLQKGWASEQTKNPPKGMELFDYTAEIQDFSDTAALIENLDLIISVDTAVAHLAGALGKSVWTLLDAGSDWRWLMNREDCPWYPTMRLFRQSSEGNWESVMTKVKDELLKLLDSN